jgi:lactate racemase
LLKLPYDKGYLELDLAKYKNVSVLIPPTAEYKVEKPQEEIVKDALENPIESQKLRELVLGKENIVLITSDHTRPVPSHITLPIILKEIKSANPDAKLTLLISTGTHRPTTEEEMLAKFGKEVLEQVTVVNHRAEEDDKMILLGTLPSGGELWINKLAMECDLLISEGFIEPHFFAGFSGGRKSILPGIVSRRTVHYNHNAQFIASPYARAGILDKNPIHEDMLWAVEQANLSFILNVVINENKEIIHCIAGHPIKAHAEGCEFVRDLTKVQAVPADIAVSTNGGFPLDQNLYQAVKGMTAAEATAKPGGVIIMVAACMDGLGGEHFYRQMVDYPSPQATMEAILDVPKEETPPDQWQAQILARILIKHKVIMVTNPDIADKVRDMHMEYAASLEEALDQAIKEKGEDSVIAIIPDGVGVIVEGL